METFTITLKQQIGVFIPKLGLALLVFVLCGIGGMVASRLVSAFGKKVRVQASVLNLFRKTVYVTLIAFGLISALGTLGINVSALVAGLGLTGFALGFALKDALSNVLAGILILVYRPFREGDQISVTGLEGMVTDIDLRYTTLHTKERKILIPNSNLFSNPVIVSMPEEKKQTVIHENFTSRSSL